MATKKQVLEVSGISQTVVACRGNKTYGRRTLLWCGGLLCLSACFGAFCLEPISGGGAVFLLAYFNSLLLLTPVLKRERFGTGLLVYLPYALLSLPLQYYVEWVKEPILIGPWAVLVWCLLHLGLGFSADLAYRYLPPALSPRWRAIWTGVCAGAAAFCLLFAGFQGLYFVPPAPLEFFSRRLAFSLPWMAVNGGFGAYTAYALIRRV